MKSKQKVYIAISGGVDSSVAALLLKNQGYTCTCVYMNLFDTNSSARIKDAEQVAKSLKLPFKVYDFRDEFKDLVIKTFIEEYKKGRTPNPCIICNRDIKFGLLYNSCIKAGADLIATGHYAQIEKDNKNKSYVLTKAADLSKDQTYFLHRLTQKQFSRLVFPIGKLKKEEVRNLAKKHNLPTATKPESQDICFLINQNIKEYINKFLKPMEGNIVDEKGKIIGIHQGYFNYTIGQREGLGIGGGIPYYVITIKPKENEVIVGKGNKNPLLFKDRIKIEKPYWISGLAPKYPYEMNACIRYSSTPAKCVIEKDTEEYQLMFDQSQRAPTPGQSAVFYRKNICLGGSIIK
jgi:tRNA-specific 2-thiouridylase